MTHSNTYLIVRGIVRAIFWGTVVVGSMLLTDTIGRLFF